MSRVESGRHGWLALAGSATFALCNLAQGQPVPAAQPTASAVLERVVVTASGTEQRLFETPYAAGSLDADELRSAGPMVNLSEALARLPGIVAQDRHNHAQDLQIHSRGFGARASFGVRGMRLYADGIPASGPDGQGQVSHMDIAGAARVEVLRGPFSALFGSSSGGVISVVSAAPTVREAFVDADLGRHGLAQWRLGVAAPFDGGFSLRLQGSRFEIDGFRPQSAATRWLGNARLGWVGGSDRVVVVLNAIDQDAQDPLGLTRAQFEADPDQTTGVALPQSLPGQRFRYDTRKQIRQEQAGVHWRHGFGGNGALSEGLLTAYAGRRAVIQWLSILDTVQEASRTQGGGVVDFDRGYRGIDGRLVWRWSLGSDRQAQFVAGASFDSSDEDRFGYENFGGTGPTRVLGITGALRRDERNRVQTTDVYAQAEFDLAPRWMATIGARHGRVAFRSDDRFIVPGNGDDSGRQSYRYTNPVAALLWRTAPGLNAYLSAGRGFESPTFAELAYRPDGGSGFNRELAPQVSRQVELGAKWRPPGRALSLDAALFDIRTDDEIGVAASSGGRTSFRNVGRTKRRGVELDLRWRIAAAWRAQVAATWLDARTLDNLLVPAGRRIAGTVARSGYAELAWEPMPGGSLALEARARGRIPVNDANADFAGGHGLLALRAQWGLAAGAGRLDLLARVDNLDNRRVVGSVIVNEGNSRFFEPTPGRTWLLSARWRMPF